MCWILRLELLVFLQTEVFSPLHSNRNTGGGKNNSEREVLLVSNSRAEIDFL